MRLDWIKNNSTGRIVDIGCNDGHTFVNSGKDVTSVDIDLYDIPNFVRADAEKLPFKDKEFDTAVLAEILEHVPNPVKVLKEAKRVAKRIILTVPNEYEWDKNAIPFNPIEKQVQETGKTREQLAREGNNPIEFYTKDDYAHLWHARFYTLETLEKDLKKAGYTYTIAPLRDGSFEWFAVIAE